MRKSQDLRQRPYLLMCLPKLCFFPLRQMSLILKRQFSRSSFRMQGHVVKEDSSLREMVSEIPF